VLRKVRREGSQKKSLNLNKPEQQGLVHSFASKSYFTISVTGVLEFEEAILQSITVHHAGGVRKAAGKKIS
jgi:hypothetical protein